MSLWTYQHNFETIQDRVLIVQGGYVSNSKGTQLNVTKKSNALDKPKPNILNSKKSATTTNNDQSNNNNSVDNNDSGSRYESQAQSAPPAPAVPEVTVS